MIVNPMKDIGEPSSHTHSSSDRRLRPGGYDETNHGYPDDHADPHHHTTEWRPGYDGENGKENGPFDGQY
ncbi:MAG TPA: hypothetical protein VND94_09690 [Terriglobia bacterium]|nr:hypothetical protein [Terriglobia bacterium]